MKGRVALLFMLAAGTAAAQGYPASLYYTQYWTVNGSVNTYGSGSAGSFSGGRRVSHF